MRTSTNLSPSMEDYLESIYLIEKNTSGSVRIKDIAILLKVKMPSVIGALKNLEKKGYIRYGKTSPPILTDKGSAVAKSVHKRHRILADFFEKVLILPASEAEDIACRIEHILSPDTAVRFENLTHFINSVIRETGVDSKEWESVIKGKKTK